MKELINIIVQKTGISQENAQKSVQVTLGFLKTKLPTPLAAQLDSFLIANPVMVGAKSYVKLGKYRTRSTERGSGRVGEAN